MNKRAGFTHPVTKQHAGFTIIEIMIVLAIAGLIMVIVFLAAPALQRNQRNEQRKRDLRTIHAALLDYYSNNGLKAPRTPTYGESNAGGWDYSSQGDFMQFLNPYITGGDVPVDPINNATGDDDGYYYRYYCYSPANSTSFGVELSTRLESDRTPYYVLTAKHPGNNEPINFKCN